MIVSNNETSLDYVPNREYDVANLILRLLPSKDGAVLRRLLMTAVSAFVLEPFSHLNAKFTNHSLLILLLVWGAIRSFMRNITIFPHLPYDGVADGF